MAKAVNYKELDFLEKFIKDKKLHKKISDKFVEETDFMDSSAMQDAQFMINDIFIQYVNKLQEAKQKVRKRFDNIPLTKLDRLRAEGELEERAKSIAGSLNSICSRIQSDLYYKAKDKYVEDTLGGIRDEKLKTELGWGIYDVICQESCFNSEDLCHLFYRIGNLVAKAYKGGQDDVIEARARRLEREREKAKAKVKKQKKGEK